MNRKIVWFNVSLEQSGGGERLSLEVIRSCRDLGNEAFYITYSYNATKTFDANYNFLNPISRGEHNLLLSSGPNIWNRIKRILWLRKKIRNIDPDIVVTSGTWGHVVDVFLATVLTKYVYVTHVFGSLFAFGPEKESTKYGSVFKKNFFEIYQSVPAYKDVVPLSPPPVNLQTKLKRELSALFKYWAVRKSSKIFVLSERNRWETERLYGKNSIVLQGAFPMRIFDFKSKVNLKEELNCDNKKVILSVGRLAANKRVDLAIQSFYILQQSCPDCILVIGGSGPERDNLEKLVNRLNITEKVLFIGFVKEVYLWDYYNSCDLFLHLDLADFDIAPLEALAIGTKVVWSNEMDIPNLENKIKGLWSVSSDPDTISEAMNEALNFTLTNEEISDRRSILKNFSWEFYTNKMIEAVYSKI
jgi:glycosyltransferase involved in cell wall biosynthesis